MFKTFCLKNKNSVLLFLVVFLWIYTPIHAQETDVSPPLNNGSQRQTEIDEEYQKLLDEGLSAFIEDNYKKAGDLFRQAIRLKPEDSTARKALKSVEEKASELTAGLEEVEKKEIDKAKMYYQNDQYFMAAMTLQGVLEKNVNQSEAKRWLDKISAKVRKLTKKEAEYSYDWLVHKGILAYTAQKYEDSLICWKKSTEINPANQMIFMAIEQTDQFLKTHPEFIVPLEKKERSECETPLPVEAKKEMPEIPVSKPEYFSPAEVIMSNVPFGPKPQAGTYPEPDKVLVYGPVLPAGMEKTAAAAIVSQIIEKAEKEEMKEPKPVTRTLRHIAADPPEIVQALHFLKNRNYVEAIHLLESYSKLNPGYLKAKELANRILSEQKTEAFKHYNRGLLEYANGNFPKAFEEWQTVLKIYPEHSNAKKVLLKAFFERR